MDAARHVVEASENELFRPVYGKTDVFPRVDLGLNHAALDAERLQVGTAGGPQAAGDELGVRQGVAVPEEPYGMMPGPGFGARACLMPVKSPS